MTFSPECKQIAADTLHMKMFSTGLNSVELASGIKFFIPSTIIEVQLDSEPRDLDLLSQIARKPPAGLRNSDTIPLFTKIVCSPLNVQCNFYPILTSDTHRLLSRSVIHEYGSYRTGSGRLRDSFVFCWVGQNFIRRFKNHKANTTNRFEKLNLSMLISKEFFKTYFTTASAKK